MVGMLLTLHSWHPNKLFVILSVFTKLHAMLHVSIILKGLILFAEKLIVWKFYVYCL